MLLRWGHIFVWINKAQIIDVRQYITKLKFALCLQNRRDCLSCLKNSYEYSTFHYLNEKTNLSSNILSIVTTFPISKLLPEGHRNSRRTDEIPSIVFIDGRWSKYRNSNTISQRQIKIAATTNPMSTLVVGIFALVSIFFRM